MAWGAFSQSQFLTVDANFEFFKDSNGLALVLTLNPRETASLHFNVDAAGTTDNLDIEILQGHLVSDGNTLDGVTSATDVELDTAVDGFSNDDDMNGLYLIITATSDSPGAVGQGRLIVDSVASDDGVNLSHAFDDGPNAGDSYALYRLVPFRFTMDPQTTITSDAQNNDGITVHAANGQYVLVVARATGATDAHRVRMSYQVDGVSI